MKIVSLAVLAVLTASPALAQQQQPCGPTAQMEKYLIEKYGESPVGMGLGPEGQVLVVIANPITGTFTILVRKPGHITCIIVGGNGYAVIPPSVPAPPEKSL
jgi:hypothetical protein